METFVGTIYIVVVLMWFTSLLLYVLYELCLPLVLLILSHCLIVDYLYVMLLCYVMLCYVMLCYVMQL